MLSFHFLVYILASIHFITSLNPQSISLPKILKLHQSKEQMNSYSGKTQSSGGSRISPSGVHQLQRWVRKAIIWPYFPQKTA